MMGPCVLLVAVTVCVCVPGMLGKPLGSLSRNDLGISHRIRRSLATSNLYDADLMSYLPSESMRDEVLYPEMSPAVISRLAAYPQEDLLAQALERMESTHRPGPSQDSMTLQQLAEEGQRRDKEALYLANLLHLWNQISQGRGYLEQLQGHRGALRREREFPRSYQDYDEEDVPSSPIRPQGSARNQLAQVLQGRYRQDDGYEGPASRLQQEDVNQDGIPMDEEMLRYLVTRVLSTMSESEMPQRLSSPSTHRLRRSLPENPVPDSPPNLLRVKRLDDIPDADYNPSGLLRRKRIDGDLDIQALPKHFTEHRVAELLKYLPD
ncbi:hypothetical protein GDO86_014701 [Hymenochirus boettgeri]|uniref:Uncharacterized protein n=1 Tax=Hymenochirus boettgeri TaxID=247094 RepID=A0A8T2JSP0_9PIPI|nr:hypothetical protein GDO86_014701 [Hymenochirus boettgeri]